MTAPTKDEIKAQFNKWFGSKPAKTFAECWEFGREQSKKETISNLKKEIEKKKMDNYSFDGELTYAEGRRDGWNQAINEVLALIDGVRK